MQNSELRDQVAQAYSRLALDPQDSSPFPAGRSLAESLGYPISLLDELPPEVVETFAGVTPISLSAQLQPGQKILDLGCGAGLDSRIAALRVGLQGTVVGVDFSSAMLDRARRAGVPNNVRFVASGAEGLPFVDESFDVVLVNGIFNLNPDRTAIFREMHRVLRPGGQAFVAELIVKPEAQVPDTPGNWFG